MSARSGAPSPADAAPAIRGASELFPEDFNLATWFLDHNLESRADKVALIALDGDTEETWSFQRIHDESCRVARVLARLGVRQEERVLIVLPDIAEFAAALFAVHRTGAVLAMANPLLPAEDLLHYFNYTRAGVAVVHASVMPALETLGSRLAHLRHALVVGDPAPGAGHGDRAFPYRAAVDAEPPEFTTARTHRDDPAVWLFTSGTSGKPKAAMHLARDFAFNTEHYAKRILGIRSDDRTLAVPKLYFGYATGTNLWFPFAVGASTILFAGHSTPEILFDCIRRYRPTVLTSVPTMINKMVLHETAASQDLSCLRACLSAGEALPRELYERWMERFGVEILDGIGSAEMFHIYISNAPGDVVRGSLGRIVPGYTARIVDPSGHDVPEGEVGTLWISGDSRMTGYFQDADKSRATLRGDWVVTGDQFRRDERGYFWYEGRADDMLKVGGVWVSPGEVENCLLQHELVRECAVVGYCDAAGLVKPRAFVVVDPGAGTDTAAVERSLIAFARERLVHYKVPREIRLLDALPRNDRGKIERRRLQEPHETKGPAS